MNASKERFYRWLVVVLFAVAMAWVEAAVVFYLRTMIHRIVPYQANPLPTGHGFAFAELVREFATLVMLLAVGWLAGESFRSRIGYSAIAFGVWDVFYYVFLRVLAPWPNSLLDWDVLFLIPLPWWGPVLAPVLISLLMVSWGTLASQAQQPKLASPRAWMLNALGIFMALVVFMWDSLHSVATHETALRNLLPARFHWPLFSLAFLLMSAPVIRELRFAVGKKRMKATASPEMNLHDESTIQS